MRQSKYPMIELLYGQICYLTGGYLTALLDVSHTISMMSALYLFTIEKSPFETHINVSFVAIEQPENRHHC